MALVAWDAAVMVFMSGLVTIRSTNCAACGILEASQVTHKSGVETHASP